MGQKREFTFTLTVRYSRIANTRQMALKSQDIVVLCKLLIESEKVLPYVQMAEDLGMSASETHGAIRRLQEGRLVAPGGRNVQRQAFRDFLRYGISHVFPAREQEQSRGIPSAWAAPVFKGMFNSDSEPPPVWAHPEGSVRGPSIAPLYKSAPNAALKDQRLYDYLALIDAVRLGRARERKAALEKLDALISGNG